MPVTQNGFLKVLVQFTGGQSTGFNSTRSQWPGLFDWVGKARQGTRMTTSEVT